jgi:predicted house-cleaning NTP pyrophosphatase (Maf/HAM1 superfamily)
VSGERLILASKSAARRAMLEGAGVPFAVQVADVDEDAVKAIHDPADAAGLAVELARVKALAVSRHDADAWVLGADQTLAFEGGLVSKAGSAGRGARAVEGYARQGAPAAFGCGPGAERTGGLVGRRHGDDAGAELSRTPFWTPI